MATACSDGLFSAGGKRMIKGNVLRVSAVALASAITVVTAKADLITVYTDRPSFNAAVGVMTIEDFTDTSHFPITTGVLNSETNLPDIGIFPGTIQPGVTYSTPIGEGNFFNIDAGGGYTGGFLDGFNPSEREVTIDFHQTDPDVARTVYAFGFDLGSLGATDFDVSIHFDSGPDQHFNFVYPAQMGFFGFVSDSKDIASVVIGNNGSFFGFDFDNFTYDIVPGPGALALLGLAGIGARRRRRTI
jgi:hypothetical protein